MHGRLKVRTTEEQKLQKHKEQQKKLAMYRGGMKQILATRNNDTYDIDSLKTCTNILMLNPDIYTLWNYRKEVVLIELNKSKTDEKTEDDKDKVIDFLENELTLTEQCLLLNPKSYGTWHHRYWILEIHPEPNWKREFELCTKYLTMDDRNFHCWDYRRLVINKVGVQFLDELAFSTERININFSNYSSWHYRSTLLQKSFEEENSIATGELKLVTNAVFTDPFDSSAWFYLKWILSNTNIKDDQKLILQDEFEQLTEMEPDCKWVLIAKCWLATSALNISDKQIESYNKLLKLDPMRCGRYIYYLKEIENKNEMA